jgi:hypothetical protein
MNNKPHWKKYLMCLSRQKEAAIMEGLLFHMEENV